MEPLSRSHPPSERTMLVVTRLETELGFVTVTLFQIERTLRLFLFVAVKPLNESRVG